MCFASSERNVNQPAPRAAKSAALLQNAGGAFTCGANPKPTRLTSQARLRPKCIRIFSPLFLSRQSQESRGVFSLRGGRRRMEVALTSRCSLGRPAAGMQGVFCLAWSSEVIQGGRFTLKWDTKTGKKMSQFATMLNVGDDKGRNANVPEVGHCWKSVM